MGGVHHFLPGQNPKVVIEYFTEFIFIISLGEVGQDIDGYIFMVVVCAQEQIMEVIPFWI